jgi:CheY-like chemotaxis protein
MDARHKLLIVDDDPTVLGLYRELLAQLPSRPEIFTANTGPRALALLKAEPFRLLLCDLKMPKMDGLQVLSIVRRQFPELRTVVMTAVQNEDLRSRAYALGVDLFWLKPDTHQNMQMFLQCIESLLGRDSESGFRGIQSKSLMDLIQMECLSQSSTLLRVTRGSLVGRIWIQAGELIDAETDEVKGELAFRRILEWKSGTFENLPAEPDRERTISKPANALLLEAAQALDETAMLAKSSVTGAESEQARGRKTGRKLAALTKAGAEFIVSVPKHKDSRAEGWGTEAVEELAAWTRHAMDACQHLAHVLQSGPLADIEARSIDQKIVLLPEPERAFLVAWPSNAKSNALTEDSRKLVASWDS